MNKYNKPFILKAGDDISPAILRDMYVMMLRIRQFEERVAELILKHEIICPCQLYIGQEAIATGVCANLRKDDYVFSNHRSHGHYLAKGGDMKTLMAEMYGKVTGCSKGRGGSMHLSSCDIGLPGSPAIVSGSISVSVGAALAFSMRKADLVSVSFFGDGAVDEGIWYESLNFASLKKMPVVFICENNLYSTHMPVSECLADTRIYQKAKSFDMPGMRIDGNNIVKVYATAKAAVENARHGNGPTLIECMTYRWRGHVGPSDDIDKGLRSREELDYWMARCPIIALERHILKNEVISETEKIRIHTDIVDEIEEAVNFAKESPYPDKDELQSGVFKI